MSNCESAPIRSCVIAAWGRQPFNIPCHAAYCAFIFAELSGPVSFKSIHSSSRYIRSSVCGTTMNVVVPETIQCKVVDEKIDSQLILVRSVSISLLLISRTRWSGVRYNGLTSSMRHTSDRGLWNGRNCTLHVLTAIACFHPILFYRKLCFSFYSNVTRKRRVVKSRSEDIDVFGGHYDRSVNIVTVYINEAHHFFWSMRFVVNRIGKVAILV